MFFVTTGKKAVVPVKNLNFFLTFADRVFETPVLPCLNDIVYEKWKISSNQIIFVLSFMSKEYEKFKTD